MKRTILVAVVLLAVNIQAQQSQPTPENPGPAIITSGNQLWSVCDHYKPGFSDPGSTFCTGYITASAHILMTLCMNKNSDCRVFAYCPGNRVTNQQLVDVVIKFLGGHPEKRDNVAFVLIGEALKGAFPCTD